MKKYDVIALGELLIDFTNNGASDNNNILFEANPGGAPCNVLSMLQNLGKKTAFIGKVGNDMFGEILIDAVKSQGIDCSYISKDNHVKTTLAFVHNDKDGDRSFSFYRNPGADMMLRSKDIDKEVLKCTTVFHFGTLSMTDDEIANTTKEVVDIAKDKGALISFDPNYRPLLWEDKKRAKDMMWYGISKCDILKISDDEISFLTGKDDIDEGIECIFNRYKPLIVCATMGKNGSAAYYKQERVFCPAFLQNNTIETTGAGDTFMACVLNSIIEKGIDSFNVDELKEMLEFANASASIITTKKGALKVMPKKKEVLDFMQKLKNEN